MIGTAVHERRLRGTGIAGWQQGTTGLCGEPLVPMDDERLLPLLPGSRHEKPEEVIQLLEFRPPMASIQNGELPAEGQILESQFRAERQGDQNQGEEAHDDRDHGREMSGPEAWKVNPVNAAGVLA
jgi:hypothetical protein